MFLFVFIAFSAAQLTIVDMAGCWESASEKRPRHVFRFVRNLTPFQKDLQNGAPLAFPYVEYEIVVNPSINQVVSVRTAIIASATTVSQVTNFPVVLVNGVSGLSQAAFGFAGYSSGTTIAQWLFGPPTQGYAAPTRTLLVGRVANGGQVFNLVLIRPSAGRPVWCSAGVPGTTALTARPTTTIPTLQPTSTTPIVLPGTSASAALTSSTSTAAPTSAPPSTTLPELLTLPPAPMDGGTSAIVFGTVGTGIAGSVGLDGGALGIGPVFQASGTSTSSMATAAAVTVADDPASGAVDFLAIGLGAGGGCLLLTACLVVVLVMLAKRKKTRRQAGVVAANYEPTPKANAYGPAPRKLEEIGQYTVANANTQGAGYVGHYRRPETSGLTAHQYTAPVSEGYASAAVSTYGGLPGSMPLFSAREEATSTAYGSVVLKTDDEPDASIRIEA
jgi:hypothetical protein